MTRRPMRAMKILHIEMGRHLYGGARQVAYLLDGLAAHPGEHGLVCAEGAEIAGALTNEAVRIHPLRMAGDLDLSFIARLRRVIRTEKPDLLHIHSRRGDWLAALAGRLEGLPMVHSRRVDNPPRWIDLKLKFPLFRKIVTISEGIREVLRGAGVTDDKLVCVPSAVDTERYRPACAHEEFRRTFGLEEGQRVLAVIAQLIPRKGHAVLFDALPAVLARHPNLRVLVFGQGPLLAGLRQRVGELGLDTTVRFEGFRTDLDRILPCLDLVVHPALMEGLGVSLLEAAACGVPIVACGTGGIPEIVHHGVNGYLVKPGDSQTLADTVVTLLNQPELMNAFRQAGRHLVLEHFSIGRMVRDNYHVYSEIVHPNGDA